MSCENTGVWWGHRAICSYLSTAVVIQLSLWLRGLMQFQFKPNTTGGVRKKLLKPSHSHHLTTIKKNLLTSRCGAQLPITHFYHASSYSPPHSLHTASNHKLAWAAMIVMLKYQTTFKLVVKKHRPKATGGQFCERKAHTSQTEMFGACTLLL